MEFLIANYEYTREKITVNGRCSQGPIRIGDVFALTYDYANPEDPTDFSCQLRKENRSHVNLEVVHIEAYRHRFSSLDEGLTASIQLRNHQDKEPIILSVIASE